MENAGLHRGKARGGDLHMTSGHCWTTGDLYRFNVDCEASSGLYGLAEGAFGTAGNVSGLDVMTGNVILFLPRSK